MNLKRLRLTVSALALFQGFPVTTASPLRAPSPYVLKDSHPVPSGLDAIARVPSQEYTHLQIVLEAWPIYELERHLYEGKAFVHVSQQ